MVYKYKKMDFQFVYEFLSTEKCIFRRRKIGQEPLMVYSMTLQEKLLKIWETFKIT